MTYPSFGNAAHLANSQTQVWSATEGNASWTVFPGGTAQCTGTMPNYVGSCGYEDGRAPFTVFASEPVPFNGNTASGSRTATLGNARNDPPSPVSRVSLPGSRQSPGSVSFGYYRGEREETDRRRC